HAKTNVSGSARNSPQRPRPPDVTCQTRAPPTPSAPRAAAQLSLRFLLLRVVFGKLSQLGLHLLDEALVPARPNDLVELGAVVGHQADTLDVDVVDHPAVTAPEEMVVHGHLRAVLCDDPGADSRKIPVYALAAVEDLLACIQLDLGDVGALEEVGKEPDELRPLRL